MDSLTPHPTPQIPIPLERHQHKLQNTWSFFYNNPKANPMLSWEEKLQKVYTFDTVEDFWA